jgi:ribose transport system ATP-binding protein
LHYDWHVKVKIGITSVPENRRPRWLCLNVLTKHNLSLPVVRGVGAFDFMKRVGVVPHVFEASRLCTVGWRSAEQSVVIAKWLMTDAQIMLPYDSTRGVGAGTKSGIYELTRSFTEKGADVRPSGSELPALVNLGRA